MQKSVQHSMQRCMMACNTLEFQKERQRQVITTLKPHIQSLQKIGLMDVALAYMKKDIQGMLENYCKMMEHADAKKVIAAILTDIVKLYKGMEKEMSDLIDCYLSKCDKTALDFMMLIMRVSLSTYAVLDDKTVSKRFEDLQDVVLTQMKRSYEKLQKGTPPKSSSKSSSKSTRTIQKSQ